MSESSAGSEGDRRGTKSAAAFRTISEVAGNLDIPQHVLRFWESKFSQIKPLKRGGGRRYYRPDDIALLQRIKELLYDDGYTIKGVQKLLREGGFKASGKDAAAGSETEDVSRVRTTRQQSTEHHKYFTKTPAHVESS